MLLIINPEAGGGKGLARWRQIQSAVRSRLASFDLCGFDGSLDAQRRIASRLREGERDFVAVGGDGTVNFLLNCLMRAGEDVYRNARIGAIGIGSSNDFHKPFRKDGYIRDVPATCDFSTAALRDVGVLKYIGDSGAEMTRYWLINASLGITAEANCLFNAPDRILRFLKRRSRGSAILYAALRTLATYSAREIALGVDDETPEELAVENLGIVKNPHFSGSFAYDSPIEYDSGNFYVHLLTRKSRPAKLVALWRLSRSSSNHCRLTRTCCAQQLTVTARTQFAVETDGEILTTTSSAFFVRKGLLRVCTR